MSLTNKIIQTFLYYSDVQTDLVFRLSSLLAILNNFRIHMTNNQLVIILDFLQDYNGTTKVSKYDLDEIILDAVHLLAMHSNEELGLIRVFSQNFSGLKNWFKLKDIFQNESDPIDKIKELLDVNKLLR